MAAVPITKTARVKPITATHEAILRILVTSTR